MMSKTQNVVRPVLAIFIDFQLCGLFKGILVQNRKSMKIAKNKQTSNGHKIASTDAI